MTGDIDGVQIEWATDAITVGIRHRKDHGDVQELADSIKRVGMLQPITIAPDGSLVCGARRLAAAKLLGKKTVRVWVRSGISDRLGKLLAEQDENFLHKPLTQNEAAALYRELKVLMAEDAARREAANQFTSEHQPRWNNGSAESAEPLTTPTGDARRQAAQMVTGSASYTKLEQIGYLETVAADTAQPDTVRALAEQELNGIKAGAPVNPAYQRIRQHTHPGEAAPDTEETEDLHLIAQETLARVRAEQKAAKKGKAQRRPAPAPAGEMLRFPVRAFVLTWTELIDWWDRYDLAQVADELTPEQAEAFYATADGTLAFAHRLRTARGDTTPTGETNSAGDDDEDCRGERRHLHAI